MLTFLFELVYISHYDALYCLLFGVSSLLTIVLWSIIVNLYTLGFGLKVVTLIGTHTTSSFFFIYIFLIILTFFSGFVSPWLTLKFSILLFCLILTCWCFLMKQFLPVFTWLDIFWWTEVQMVKADELTHHILFSILIIIDNNYNY